MSAAYVREVAFGGSEYVNASDDAIAAARKAPGAHLTAALLENRRTIRADATAYYQRLQADGRTYRCHGRRANTLDDFIAATIEWREVDGREGFPPPPLLPSAPAPTKRAKGTTRTPRKRDPRRLTPDGVARPKHQYMKPAKRRAIVLTGEGWDEFRNAAVIDSNRWPGL